MVGGGGGASVVGGGGGAVVVGAAVVGGRVVGGRVVGGRVVVGLGLGFGAVVGGVPNPQLQIGGGEAATVSPPGAGSFDRRGRVVVVRSPRS